MNDLLDLYLDGLDADERLSPRTRHDYREFADTGIRSEEGFEAVDDVSHIATLPAFAVHHRSASIGQEVEQHAHAEAPGTPDASVPQDRRQTSARFDDR